MDFLDPKRKKAHKRRLLFGYALMSVLIGIGTMTLLYLAYGYDVNRETGKLIQNGIVFVDSKPQGASVFLNDVRQPNTTSTRLDIPAGTYTVRLENEGYRSWERTFGIDGGQFQRLVYPLLIPNVLETSDVQTYDTMPGLTTQSPDRRWLLIQKPASTYQFDLFDLNNPDDPAKVIQIPVALLTEPSAEASIKISEWSNDNRHVLIERSYGDKKTEFIMFDRENPNESININVSLGINPTKATLRNKRPDQLYFKESTPGALRIANTKDRNISAPLANGVIDYSTYGDDKIMFATSEEAANGKIFIKILDNDKLYNLKTVSESSNYLLDISKYDNQWFYVAGSSKDNITFIYEDPISSLKDGSNKPLDVKAIIRLDNPRFVSFSANTQFISVQSGKQFTVLDLEEDEQYNTTLDHDIKIGQELKWMDGHRLIYVVNNQSYIIDFDGSNENTLVTSMGVLPYFDRDYDNVYTLEGSKMDATKQALTVTVIDD